MCLVILLENGFPNHFDLAEVVSKNKLLLKFVSTSFLVMQEKEAPASNHVRGQHLPNSYFRIYLGIYIPSVARTIEWVQFLRSDLLDQTRFWNC